MKILFPIGLACLMLAGYIAGNDPDEKVWPVKFLSSFDAEKNSSYELIEEEEYYLSEERPGRSCSDQSGAEQIVFSFTDTGFSSVNYTVTIENGTESEVYRGGLTGDGAFQVSLEPESIFRLEYSLGIKEEPDSVLCSEELVESAAGKIQIYRRKG